MEATDAEPAHHVELPVQAPEAEDAAALADKERLAKAAADAEAAKHQKKRDALESEVNQLKTQVLGDETKFHRMNIESTLVEAHASRPTGPPSMRESR